jgi:hypothetical protein
LIIKTNKESIKLEDRKNIVEFIHAKDIELLILNYLEEKANIIKENDPYNFVRLNEIKSELRRIFLAQ